MAQAPGRTLWIDQLRTTLTLLVVGHHASLAYTTFASFHPQAYIQSTHPVVDGHRWAGMDIFENFNDVFFMPLLFFISGLFVWPALQKKGLRQFIRDRFFRLFVPFAIGVSLLMLLAYYPAYLQAYGRHDLRHFVIDFFTTEQWPVGPPWFVWVLFAFNLLIAAGYPLVQKVLPAASRRLLRAYDRPGRLWRYWWLLTAVLYVPLALWVGAGTWTGWGPFDLQLSRIAWYFGYFLLGVAAGSHIPATGLLAGDGVARRWWPRLASGCGLAYTALTLIAPRLEPWVKAGLLTEPAAWAIYFALYVSAATASCLAFLFTYRALAHRTHPVIQSLSANAYGIYLVHYVFVTWCQYLLLPAGLHAAAKFAITFTVSLALSWGLVALLRKAPVIARWL